MIFDRIVETGLTQETVQSLLEWFGKDKTISYAIPNTAAAVGESMTYICPVTATGSQAADLASLLGKVGRTVVTEVPYEAFPSDYGTAVSVIALRNTNAADPKAVTRATYSNYNRVDESGSAFERDKNISAPGSAIYSTNGSGGYDSMSGTSMAAPVVAGTLGLVFSANQGLESADVALTQRDASAADHAKSILYATARDLGDAGWDPYYGYGEVDAAAAVAAATTGVLQGPAYLKTGETATYHVSSKLDGWSLSSADAEVLTVGASGAAEAISAGTADVVASASDSVGKTHTALLTVNVFGPMSGASELPVDCTYPAKLTVSAAKPFIMPGVFPFLRGEGRFLDGQRMCGQYGQCLGPPVHLRR